MGYHSHFTIDFSNILSKGVIERLAEVDEYEVVREIQVRSLKYPPLSHFNPQEQEYFADYTPILPGVFSLNHTPSVKQPLYGSSPSIWAPEALEAHVKGILAVLLSLKKKPIIRYERMSPMAKKLGTEIQV